MALLGSLPDDMRLIGGLAVMCRVGVPHRTTVDLDVVTRGLDSHHESINRLALTSSGGGQYSFEGGLDLDVIDVAPESAEELIDQLGDEVTDLELAVVAHTWAHDHAAALDIVAVDDSSGERLAEAVGRLVATTVGLVVMKAAVVPLRASSKPEKRASDLYDLGRLLTAGHPDPADVDALPPLLRRRTFDRLHDCFVDDAGRDRTYRDVRRFDEPLLDLDDVADAVEQLSEGRDGADQGIPDAATPAGPGPGTTP
ncbi:MAG: hypothetical protein ACKOYM_07790 [Actinomycetes bacterium]